MHPRSGSAAEIQVSVASIHPPRPATRPQFHGHTGQDPPRSSETSGSGLYTTLAQPRIDRRRRTRDQTEAEDSTRITAAFMPVSQRRASGACSLLASALIEAVVPVGRRRRPHVPTNATDPPMRALLLSPMSGHRSASRRTIALLAKTSPSSRSSWRLWRRAPAPTPDERFAQGAATPALRARKHPTIARRLESCRREGKAWARFRLWSRLAGVLGAACSARQQPASRGAATLSGRPGVWRGAASARSAWHATGVSRYRQPC